MPKQWLTINDFSGGMVNATDARDINLNESPKIENFILDKRKSLTTFGGEKQHQDIPSGDDIVICPGFGMFIYGSDHQRGIVDKDSFPPVWRNATDDGESWMSIVDSSSGDIFLYDNSSKIVNKDYGDNAVTPLISIGTPNSFNVGTYYSYQSSTGNPTQISRLQFLGPHSAFIMPTTENNYNNPSHSNFKNPEGEGSDWWFKPGDIVNINGCTAVSANNVNAARIKSVSPVHFGSDVDTNMIIKLKNSNMNQTTDWIGFGTTLIHDTETNIGGQGPDPPADEEWAWLRRLKFDNTGVGTSGGANLLKEHFSDGTTTIIGGNTYFVAVTIWCDSGTMDGFKVSLFGTSTDVFTITSKIKTYVFNIKVDIDTYTDVGGMAIYSYAAPNGTYWYISNVIVTRGGTYIEFEDDTDFWVPGQFYLDGTTQIPTEVSDVTITLSPKVIYYFVDEALRVCDTTMVANLQPKWWGYVKRVHLADSNGAPIEAGRSIDRWYQSDNNLAAPIELSVIDSESVAITAFAQGSAGAGQTDTDVTATLHGFQDGDSIIIDSTINYNGTYTIDTVDANSFDIGTNYIAQLETITSGSITDAGGNVDDTYYNVSLTTSGNGTGAKATVIVSSDAISSIAITEKGTGYIVGETMTVPAGSVGVDGGGGSSPVATVSSVESTGNAYLATALTFPTAGAGFHISVISTTSALNHNEGTWLVGKYECALSFIYDGVQESLLYIPTTSNVFTVATDASRLVFNVGAKDGGSAYNERLSGGRIYFRENGTNDDWQMLCEINMTKGARVKPFGDWTAWTRNYNAIGNLSHYNAEIINLNSMMPNIDTYETLNGFSQNEKSISITGSGQGYKTALVANRRCFVANVKTEDEDGAISQKRDRIMYSPIDRFDTFPRDFAIDVVKGDAEDYVKLLEYADRLLAFKQRRLHIINIADPEPTNWFLEDIKDYAGIVHPSASVKTEFGICWVNEFGCFLYDGQGIRNLIFNKIDEEIWSGFITKESSLFYNPKKFYIACLKDYFGGEGSIYIYDFRTKSWIRGSSTFGSENNRTNFVSDWNANASVVFQETNIATTWNTVISRWEQGIGGTWSSFLTKKLNVREWSDELPAIGKAIDSLKYITKDLDFNHPSINKKIYTVLITYMSDKKMLQPLSYSVNGTNIFSNKFTGDFVDSHTESLPGAASVIAGTKDVAGIGVDFEHNISIDDGIKIGDEIHIVDEIVSGARIKLRKVHSAGASGVTINKAVWQKTKFTLSSPVLFQSIALKIENTDSNTGNTFGIKINDISIEYRVLQSKGVS